MSVTGSPGTPSRATPRTSDPFCSFLSIAGVVVVTMVDEVSPSAAAAWGMWGLVTMPPRCPGRRDFECRDRTPCRVGTIDAALLFPRHDCIASSVGVSGRGKSNALSRRRQRFVWSRGPGRRREVSSRSLCSPRACRCRLGKEDLGSIPQIFPGAFSRTPIWLTTPSESNCAPPMIREQS